MKQKQSNEGTLQDIIALAAATPGVVPLTIGMPVYSLDTSLQEYLSNLILSEPTINKYPPFAGIHPLRDAIATVLQKQSGIKVTHDNILITAGAMEGLYVAINVVTNPGDEVVILTPCFPPQIDQIRLRGAVAVEVPLHEEGNWRADIDAVKKAVTSRTKAIMITSPNNPTGSRLSKEDIRSIVGIAQKHSLYIISDETYYFLNYTGEAVSLADFEMREKCIIVRSFSKQFAMTGLRVGFVCADIPLINRMLTFHETTIGFVSSISQYAALYAVTSFPEKTLRHYITDFRQKLSLTMEQLEKYKDVLDCQKPEGAFFAFPRYNAKITSMELTRSLITEAGVAVFPGGIFGTGGEGHIRLSFAGSEEHIIEGIGRVGNYLKTLDS